MNATKIINIVLVVAVLVAVAWGISLVHVPKPQGAMEHALSGTLTADGDYKYSEGDQYYSIVVRYPAKTTLGRDADIVARTTIEQGVLSQVTNFHQILSESLTTDEKARLEESGAQYAFDAQYKEYGSNNFDSFLYTMYQDTGGAHPNGFFATFVFDKNGETVSLGGLFKPGTKYLERLAQAATAQVRQQLSERLGSGDIVDIFKDGLDPTESNFENFVVDGDNLHIFFPPYQVAAYAAGTFDITVPLSSLTDILADGVR